MDKQREAFERWCNKNDGLPDNFPINQFTHDIPAISQLPELIGKYQSHKTQSQWEAWQAAKETTWHPISEVPPYKFVWAYCKEANVKGVASETGGCMVASYVPPSQHIPGLFVDALGITMNWSFTHWCYLPQFGGE